MTLHFEPRANIAAAPAQSGALSFEPPVPVGIEAARDVAAREALLDEAFGAARWTKTADQLREGRLPAKGLSLVARDQGVMVGTLRCWNVRAGGKPALLLGPLAVAKSHRSRGIGAKLMHEALWRAAMLGHKAVLLVGDAPYYGRFGFGAALAAALDLPGPVDRARFLGFEIEDGALNGASGLVRATGAKAASAARTLRKAA
jgi:predicted N-acetyltransferase YhbS